MSLQCIYNVLGQEPGTCPYCLDVGGIVEPGQTIDRDIIMLVSLSISVPPKANNPGQQVYAGSWLLCSQLKTDLQTQVHNLKLLFPD